MAKCEYQILEIHDGGEKKRYAVQALYGSTVARVGEAYESRIWVERFVRLLERYEVGPELAQTMAADFFKKNEPDSHAIVNQIETFC